jgi:phosphoglycolate phosphatase
MLKNLAGRGIAMCAFSNKPHRDTVSILEHYLPEIPFSVILGQTDRFPVKPDPAGALWIAEEAGIPPPDWIYVGDSAVDMTCAVRAGMHPVGALWGFRDAEELTAGGAERLIARPGELGQLFGR